jgi:hypothetical protein
MQAVAGVQAVTGAEQPDVAVAAVRAPVAELAAVKRRAQASRRRRQ